MTWTVEAGSHAQFSSMVDPITTSQHPVTTDAFVVISHGFYTIMTRQRINGRVFTIITWNLSSITFSATDPIFVLPIPVAIVTLMLPRTQPATHLLNIY